MPLSYRARALDATTKGVPAEDVLRLVRPAQYMFVLNRAYDAYSSKAARDALEFVDMLSREKPDGRRQADVWRRTVFQGADKADMLSDRAIGMLQEVANVMEKVRPNTQTPHLWSPGGEIQDPKMVLECGRRTMLDFDVLITT